MKDFEFSNRTKIIFGADSLDKVGSETKTWSNKVLLHCGGRHIKRSGLYDQITESLKNADVQYIELSGVKPNPRLSLVKEGIELCRKNSIQFILAVGGGSVIDSAKAIAAGVPYDGDVWDFYTGKAKPKAVLDTGVVLTIPAAGSESSNGTVITDEDNNNKRPFGDESLRPRFAIMNPRFTFSLPAYQTACGAADIMAHVMERYFTRVQHVELTDRLCESVLKTVIGNVPKALACPDDYDVRAEIMWAGTIAHNDLLSTGRIGDWASHNIEHELSAINDVAHGAGLAIIFPAWIRYVYKQDPALFAQYAVRVWNVEMDYRDIEATALVGIERLKAFFKSIGLPTSLTEIGIDESHYARIAGNCARMDGDTVGQFVKLTENDIINILKIAQ